MTDQSANDQFHASSFLQGHNADYIDQLQARYAADPASRARAVQPLRAQRKISSSM